MSSIPHLLYKTEIFFATTSIALMQFHVAANERYESACLTRLLIDWAPQTCLALRFFAWRELPPWHCEIQLESSCFELRLSFEVNLQQNLLWLGCEPANPFEIPAPCVVHPKRPSNQKHHRHAYQFFAELNQ